MSQELKIIENFSRYIAPWIIEQDFVKEIIGLQMFSNPATHEKFHILICGSVGVAKSVLLHEVSTIMPNSSFTGKKVTPIGMLEVLQDTENGILSVDELDKIDPEAQEQLLQVMSMQTISIHKHMMRITKDVCLNVLAGCNPRNFTLDEYTPLHLQLPFDPPLISRFHLLIPMKSMPATKYKEISVQQEFDMDKYINLKKDITDQIIEIRQKIPKVFMSKEMASKVGTYVQMLKQTSKYAKIITPRIIEGFKSALQSRARMQGRSQVNDSDFTYVKKIFHKLYYR